MTQLTIATVLDVPVGRFLFRLGMIGCIGFLYWCDLRIFVTLAVAHPRFDIVAFGMLIDAVISCLGLTLYAVFYVATGWRPLIFCNPKI